MGLGVCFRYGEREYYREFAPGETVSFGCHPKDQIQIPGSKEHLLTLKANGDDLSAAALAPLSLPSPIIECNTLLRLSAELKAYLYASRVIRRSGGISLPYNGKITVGRSNDRDIVIPYPVISRNHFQFLLENGTVHVEDTQSTMGVYLNGRRISKARMKSGDVLSILAFRFILENGMLYFENIGSQIQVSKRIREMDRPAEPEAKLVRPEAKKAASPMPADVRNEPVYPVYRLSPRVREQLPHETIVLSSAPGKGAAPGGRRGNSTYLLSSAAMMAASIATGMISPIANMAMYSKMSKEEQRQFEEYEKMRQERYQAYIDARKARIAKVADVQRRIISAENPSPAACIDTVNVLKRNLWEQNKVNWPQQIL